MNRILLADDSPHAQRLGERILREEGYEVHTAADGESAMTTLAAADPDLILADVSLPGKTGYAVCEAVKTSPQYRHARVVLLAGLLEKVDEAEASRVKADAVLKKPFEPSEMLSVVRTLVEAAAADRAASTSLDIDAERVRAAVTLAMYEAMPLLIDEITDRVLLALKR